jgi:hypothetical protein
MARAWSPAAIETASGIPARDIDRMLADERNVTPALAAAVARAYDRLWDRQPPRSTAETREATSAALAHACRRGWAPPLAWDDDQIDHPSGRPADGWKPANGGAGRRSALDLAEDAAWVREHGGYRHASVGEIAARLGVSRSRLEQALCRARKYASAAWKPRPGSSRSPR